MSQHIPVRAALALIESQILMYFYRFCAVAHRSAALFCPALQLSKMPQKCLPKVCTGCAQNEGDYMLCLRGDIWGKNAIFWCPETDLNRRHADFQSAALPTELSGPSLAMLSKAGLVISEGREAVQRVWAK